MTKTQLKRRMSKKVNKESFGRIRRNEYFQKKTDTLVQLIRRAIIKGIRFDYLLVDSWFVNDDLISFITTRKINCHLLGMAKMGNFKYSYKGKMYTAKQLVDKQKRNKKITRSRKLNIRHTM